MGSIGPSGPSPFRRTTSWACWAGYAFRCSSVVSASGTCGFSSTTAGIPRPRSWRPCPRSGRRSTALPNCFWRRTRPPPSAGRSGRRHSSPPVGEWRRLSRSCAGGASSARTAPGAWRWSTNCTTTTAVQRAVGRGRTDTERIRTKPRCSSGPSRCRRRSASAPSSSAQVPPAIPSSCAPPTSGRARCSRSSTGTGRGGQTGRTAGGSLHPGSERARGRPAGLRGRAAPGAARGPGGRVDPQLGDIPWYAEIGVYQFLGALGWQAPSPGSIHFGELSEADRVDELLPVLELLYDKNGSVQDVAGQLHLHRSSVYNRLARIRSAIGADPLAGSVRLELHLALKARRWRRRPRFEPS
ncbi:hypothetical protein GM708_11350 [Vibrio cholerae]|nr:hypothetical protein [Vibrio cholerae]